MSKDNNILRKAKKKFRGSIKYQILLCVFIHDEISLDALFMKFRMSKATMYSMMRYLEREGLVERSTCPNSQIFYKIKK